MVNSMQAQRVPFKARVSAAWSEDWCWSEPRRGSLWLLTSTINTKCAPLSGFTTSDRLRRSFLTAFRVQAALAENGSLAWTLPQEAIFDGFLTPRVTQRVVKLRAIQLITSQLNLSIILNNEVRNKSGETAQLQFRRTSTGYFSLTRQQGHCRQAAYFITFFTAVVVPSV